MANDGNTKRVRFFEREASADPFVYVGSVSMAVGDVAYEGYAKGCFGLEDREVLAMIDGNLPIAYTFTV